MERFQAPRGTHDVLPDDGLWWHVVRTMEDLAALYAWRRIQTPMLAVPPTRSTRNAATIPWKRSGSTGSW